AARRRRLRPLARTIASVCASFSWCLVLLRARAEGVERRDLGEQLFGRGARRRRIGDELDGVGFAGDRGAAERVFEPVGRVALVDGGALRQQVRKLDGAVERRLLAVEQVAGLRIGG